MSTELCPRCRWPVVQPGAGDGCLSGTCSCRCGGFPDCWCGYVEDEWAAAERDKAVQAERDREHYAMRGVTPTVVSVGAAWLREQVEPMRAVLEAAARLCDAGGCDTAARMVREVLDRLALVRVAATGRDARQGGWEEVLATREGERTPEARQDGPGGVLGGAEGLGRAAQAPRTGEAPTGVTGAIGRGRG